MSFEFTAQAPAEAIDFNLFISENEFNFNDTEPVKIVFVDTDTSNRDYYKTIWVTLSFNNPKLENKFTTFNLMGKSENTGISTGIKFIHGAGIGRKEVKLSYEFMKSLLVADGIMDEKSNNAIVEKNVQNIELYLNRKEFVLNGHELEKGRLIVEAIE